jgi:hypothetical protein
MGYKDKFTPKGQRTNGNVTAPKVGDMAKGTRKANAKVKAKKPK